MKILDITVRNFAPIMVAMKKKELVIDFRRGENLLTLIVGGNGTGKTTITSLLHPFAYNGDIDRRENDIIMKDESGYKSLTIEYNGDIFFIEHHYKRGGDGSITLKSFMQRNGEELNENGNVTSFKTLVQNYLGIDESYLKITRLGANVTNIINMNSSERKDFMNKRLEELNKYGALYKKTSEDLRVIKALLKINVNNMNKLNIDNIDLFKLELKNAVDRYEKLLDRKDTIQNEIGLNKGKILALTGDADIETTLNGLYREKSILESDIQLNEDKLGGLNSDIDKEKAFSKYSRKNKEFNSTMEELNALYGKRNKIDALMASYTSVKYLEDIKAKRDNLLEDIKKHESIYGDRGIKHSSTEFKEVLSTLQSLENMYDHIYSIPTKLMKTILVDSKGELDYYIRSLETKLAYIYNSDKNSKLKSLLGNSEKSLYVMIEPNCGFERCTYRRFYQDMIGDIEDTDDKVSDNPETLMELIEDARYLKSFEKAVKSNNRILSRVPKGEYSFESIITRVMKGLPFINEQSLTDYIGLAMLIEEYEGNKTKVNELNDEIDKLTGSNDINKLIISKNTIDANIASVESRRDSIKEELIESEKIYNKVLQMETLINNIKSSKDKLSSIEEDIKNKNELSNSVSSYRDIVHRASLELERLVVEEKQLNEKIEKGKLYVKEYSKLAEERSKLNKDYEDWSLVVDSVAAKKGIPLEFINYYLESIRVLTNDCLRVVYGDDLYISKMHADEKTFDIIYIKDGLVAGDIRSASQGESSFINMAISFAFLASELKDYNIIVLDEVDGVLDTEKRSKFIDILYDRLREMRCEQCFLISHSEIYNSQDVDIVITDDSDVSRYVKANVVFHQ